MDKEKIYIILVNFNSYSNTIECLESLLKTESVDHQIIIVDNSISDESINHFRDWAEGATDVIETKFPDLVYPLSAKPLSVAFISENKTGKLPDSRLIFIRANSNRGFAAANNIALDLLMKNNDWQWAWLLNNDTVVPQDTLLKFSLYCSKLKEKVGMVGHKIFYYDTPLLLQGIGGTFNRLFSTSAHIGEGQEDRGQFNKQYQYSADYVIGASMFVKKDFIKETGFMDEAYFLYYEEIDWALRGKSRNWEIAYCPDIYVYHKEGASINPANRGKSALGDFYSIRNRILLAKKHFPVYLPIIYISMIGVLINRIKRGQLDRIKVIIRAVFK